MPLYIEQSGDLDRCYRCFTHSLTHRQTLKERATQLLIKYKNGALVPQLLQIISDLFVEGKVCLLQFPIMRVSPEGVEEL